MLGLALGTIIGILAVGLVVDLALLWVTTALLDSEVHIGRLLLGTVLTYGVFVGVAFGAYIAVRALAPDLQQGMPWGLISLFALLGLLVTMALTGLICALVLGISFGKSLWGGVIQMLLRMLLYALIIGVVSVVLASIQISRGTPRESAQAPLPAPLAGRTA